MTSTSFPNTDPDVIEFGIPNITYFGDHGGYKVLVMKMLGPTIQDLKEVTKNYKLSGKTLLKIAIQAVSKN